VPPLDHAPELGQPALRHCLGLARSAASFFGGRGEWSGRRKTVVMD
jgi:hypothetical protein